MPRKRSTHAQRSHAKQMQTRRVSARKKSGKAPGAHHAGPSSAPSGQTIPHSPSHSSLLLSRRHFLYGALGIGAVAATVGGAIALTGSLQAKEADDELTVLEVPTDAVTTSDACVEIDDITGSVSLIGSFELPFGTLIWTNNDTVAACLLPTSEAARPLTQVSLLFLDTGENRIVLEQAVSQAEGFDIYDVRANEQGLVWTEANILDGIWRIYTASYGSQGLATPALVDEGDSKDWETPSLAAVGSYAFWQVLPALGGSTTKEPSLLKRVALASGSADTAEVIYTSIGRMSTAIYPLAESLVITPRTDSTSINHQLTLLDAEQGEVLDKVVLPTSMKPLEAGYGANGFTFSFDAWYSYGEGIANIGTYTPAKTHGIEDYAGLPWFNFSRTPTAAPAWCNGWFIVKSTRAVCGIDIANMTYFALPVESGCDDYGDYLATTGNTSKIVTFTNIDQVSIDGTEKKVCLVRAWAPIA